MKYQLLILSEDAVFARMLELEFLIQHLSVHIDSHEDESTEAEVTLIDLDSVIPPVSAQYGRMIGFTRNFSISAVDPERTCSMILHRPFEMRLLREEVMALMSGRVEHVSRERLRLEGETLSFGNRSVSLSPNERKMMALLLERRSETVLRKDLSDLIGESSANKAEVYICYLRKKLEELTGRGCIRTVRGKGYLFSEP